MAEIFGLLALAAGGFLLWGNLKARETANAAIRAACRAEGLLFLDDTVGLDSMRPVRDDEGRLRIRRVYGFQFSDTGHNRRTGRVALVGDTLAGVDVGGVAVPDVPTLH